MWIATILIGITIRYSNVSRGELNRMQQELADGPPPTRPGSGPTERDHSLGPRALRRCWAEMIMRVYKVDPLVCDRCGGEMRIIALIVDPTVVDTILRYLSANEGHRERAPPGWAELEAAS